MMSPYFFVQKVTTSLVIVTALALSAFQVTVNSAANIFALLSECYPRGWCHRGGPLLRPPSVTLVDGVTGAVRSSDPLVSPSWMVSPGAVRSPEPLVSPSWMVSPGAVRSRDPLVSPSWMVSPRAVRSPNPLVSPLVTFSIQCYFYSSYVYNVIKLLYLINYCIMRSIFVCFCCGRQTCHRNWNWSRTQISSSKLSVYLYDKAVVPWIWTDCHEVRQT